MDITISPLNLLKLWNLLAVGGEEWNSLIRPALDAKERERLRQLGLLQTLKKLPGPEDLARLKKAPKEAKSAVKEPKAKDETGKTKKAPVRELIKIKLTDRGLTYLGDHLGDPISKTSTAAAPVLIFIMERLGAKKRGREAINDLLGMSGREVVNQPNAVPQALSLKLTSQIIISRIRTISPQFFMAGGGLRLSELRKVLPEFDKEEIDRTLLDMQKERQLVLYRFDSPALVTAADAEATLYISGAPRHYLFLK
ncbi:MAG: hypothetical protein LBT47_12990 [Deltaproteobacteria bacterium]|jgi:hypothetical protein|nr:hypothetical protein [Deltaproteobacteria bacterium]